MKSRCIFNITEIALNYYYIYFEKWIMEGKSYFLGLLKNVRLVVEENRLFYYFDGDKNMKMLVECNKSDNSMTLSRKKLGDKEFISS